MILHTMNYHIGSFIGFSFFIYILTKALIPKIRQTISDIQNSEKSLNNKINQLKIKVNEYEEKLKQIKEESSTNITKLKQQTDEFISLQKDEMQKYYKTKTAELQTSLQNLLSKKKQEINKKVISETSDFISKTDDNLEGLDTKRNIH